MKKYTKEDASAIEVKFNGTEYAFIVDKKHGIGIRRKDAKEPTVNEVRMVTKYALSEGFANKEDFEEIY